MQFGEPMNPDKRPPDVYCSSSQNGAEMPLTKHAKQRMQQRSIPPIIVDCLIRFGHSEPSGDGTRKYYFDKSSHRRFQKYAGQLSGILEQYLNVYVVLANDFTVVTVAPRCERIRRH